MDWGLVGATACSANVVLVVDVLSFSTSVTLATERGTRVYPSPWNDQRAQALAAEHDAVLAIGRLEASRLDGVTAPSLSPAHLQRTAPVPRLVLPSPNGSTIATTLGQSGSAVAIGCLRNARAAGAWAAQELAAGRSVAIIAAGERWGSDKSLRPALEDQLGAGAIASHLVASGHAHACSPEALAAAALFQAMARDLHDVMHTCVGGRELAAIGFESDVDVAAELDASIGVPILEDGAFAI